MKKVAVIAHALCDEGIAGIHRYTLETLKCLDSIINTDEVELLIPASEIDNYNFKHIKVVRMGIRVPIPGLLGVRVERFLTKNVFAPLYIKKKKEISVDLELQFPLFSCDVIAVYDCRVNKYPEFYQFSKEQRRNRKVVLKHQNNSIRKCKAIVTDSETIKDEIQDWYGDYKKPIYVTHCGWQHFEAIKEDRTILERLGLEEYKYFFSLGTRFPHKNIKWVSYAAKRHPSYTFVISGTIRSQSNMEFEGEKTSNMIFAGRLTDSEVKALMKYSKAFIQPSLYEGFGIPPLEAMSAGANCIVSDIPVFREIYKNSVWYIDPNDYQNIDIDRTMQTEKDKNEVILEEFSWEKSANKLWNCLKIVSDQMEKRSMR